MTQKEFDDCKKVILDKLTYLKGEATKAKISTPKLIALEKQVTDAINEFVSNHNQILESKKMK
jgi:hypothetical protein